MSKVLHLCRLLKVGVRLLGQTDRLDLHDLLKLLVALGLERYLVDGLLVLEGVGVDEHVVDRGGAIEMQIYNPGLGFVDGVALVGPTLHGALVLLRLVRLEIALRLNLELRLALG